MILTNFQETIRLVINVIRALFADSFKSIAVLMADDIFNLSFQKVAFTAKESFDLRQLNRFRASNHSLLLICLITY